MSTVDWPERLLPQTCSLRLRKSGGMFTSPFNGTMQATDFMSERWILSVQLAEQSRRDPRGLESFIGGLSGGINRVRGWHFGKRGIPRGTLRGTPTLALAASFGDQQLELNNVVNGTTLLADDMLMLISGQLVQVSADTLASGGRMTVNITSHIRQTASAASAVVWNRPYAQFVLPAMEAGAVWSPGRIDGVALDLVETW